ncbi:phenylacetic acid degradation bifunctional protein PaaZ [Gynurincola endophyticus]|jgi:oxepin-CoA hydrolase/3-oxo-5,6-dehydrosuberyl-CoA semialdehyde dehydrogenase|uniref:phenylacetic acid degradation bifunctional protein PaaZ n=1 Tax=Gynurincola endophyticus TaxID=2479004 RepID=UPI000F8D42B8|nr:phenylacetic acid degradation bifunctional protein PaaZ [Gynurincola endophyticus]
MKLVQSYVCGSWQIGDLSSAQVLYNAVTGEPIGQASTKGLDFKNIVEYARKHGGTALSKMTFHERGLMLRALALHLRNHLPELYKCSYQSGATKADSWIDIEGGIGNLFSYASLRRQFPDEYFCTDGDAVPLGKQGFFMAQHILVPKEGVAVHINAFNFPVWGMLEKIAVNLLAGVPAIVKPATVTSYLTELAVKIIIDSKILPEGALQLITGSAGDLLNHLSYQDVVTFTGSAQTGAMLKAHPRILGENIPFNMEADSLNAIVLGNDVAPSDPEWDIFIKEVRRELTIKAGQKCTAIRRIFIPHDKVNAVVEALKAALTGLVIGNPANEKVRMGSLAGQDQKKELKAQLSKLTAESSIIFGSLDEVDVLDADAETGAFVSPVLLYNENPFSSVLVHEVEAFGPVSTIMPYHHLDEAIHLTKLGKGSLVSTIVTADDRLARQFVLGAATHHGRILILNRTSAKESTGHGSPLPLLIHGGPGRAGGGEEMGGVRGVKHYMQRVAVQGSPTSLTRLINQYQPNAETISDGKHPFRKYFDELVIGEEWVTHKRTVTDADIVNFANVSWDHFYAHTDHTSLEGTIFEKPVAHGYFILSAAAGLFVDPAKGPVLLNYGLEECRFLKPVYAGTTIGVRLICKQKIKQETKSEEDIPKGIVKWYVEVLDQQNELVAVATILTMVKMK